MLELLHSMHVRVIIAFCGAFFITWWTIPAIIKVAELKHLFDEPDARKTHRKKTPTLGGIAIFAGIIITYSLLKDLHNLTDVRFLVPALIIIFFAGIKDDILTLTPFKKFLAQLSAAVLIVVLGEIKINSFYGLFGIQEMSYWLSIIFSTVAIITIINCYNLIDGVDGLAGSLGLLSALCFGLWFMFTEHWSLAFLAFSLVGSLLGLLVYNWQPAKIFMGDTGAMLIGFILSVLAIHFIELNKARTIVDEFWIHASPSVAIGVMAIPIFDMIRVFGVRLLERRSPFHPDRNHIHHLLLDFNFSHAQISSLLFLWSIAIVSVCGFLRHGKSSVLLVVLIMTVFVPSVILQKWRNNRKPKKPRP